MTRHLMAYLLCFLISGCVISQNDPQRLTVLSQVPGQPSLPSAAQLENILSQLDYQQYLGFGRQIRRPLLDPMEKVQLSILLAQIPAITHQVTLSIDRQHGRGKPSQLRLSGAADHLKVEVIGTPQESGLPDDVVRDDLNFQSFCDDQGVIWIGQPGDQYLGSILVPFDPNLERFQAPNQPQPVAPQKPALVQSSPVVGPQAPPASQAKPSIPREIQAAPEKPRPSSETKTSSPAASLPTSLKERIQDEQQFVRSAWEKGQITRERYELYLGKLSALEADWQADIAAVQKLKRRRLISDEDATTQIQAIDQQAQDALSALTGE